MKVEITAPGEHEARLLEDSADVITIEPLVPRNQHMVRVGHIKAVGESGKVAHGTIQFNGKTGEFRVVAVKESDTKLPFDLPDETADAAGPKQPQ